MHFRVGGEELDRILDAHGEDVGYGCVFIGNRQGFIIESLSAAAFALDPNIRQEIHFDALLSLAVTDVATTATHVERESARGITP